MTNKKNKFRTGFTIIELLVVIVIIGILAAISLVSYNGIQAKARDASVMSDLDTMDALQTNYGLKNGLAGKAYYSGNGPDAVLGFTPSSGNVIDVVVNGSDYCIRGYSVSGTKNTIYNSFIKESSVGACSIISESAAAVQDSPGSVYIPKIAVGWYHTCAIASNNQAYCWGRGTSGELGSNLLSNSSVPTAVYTGGTLNGKTIQSIGSSPGAQASCVVASDNQLYCWGRNATGQNGNFTDAAPLAIDNSGVLNGKTILSTTFNCAIASDHKAYCWGYNLFGQLGNNSTVNSTVPVAVYSSGALSDKTILSISSGTGANCAVASDNQAYCWGYNDDGRLGNNSTVRSSVPVAVDASGVLSGKTILSISVGSYHACVIASDHLAYCWGNNYYGQLGNNSTANSSVPVSVITSGVLGGKTILSISAGENHTCVVASDGKAYCWGQNDNGSGRLGNNSTINSSVPVAVNTSGVLNGRTLMSIYSGASHTCAVASNGKIFCWGSNLEGELGNNSTTTSLVPVLVNPLP